MDFETAKEAIQKCNNLIKELNLLLDKEFKK
jgi:flagellin-specific chaperone FliS